MFLQGLAPKDLTQGCCVSAKDASDYIFRSSGLRSTCIPGSTFSHIPRRPGTAVGPRASENRLAE